MSQKEKETPEDIKPDTADINDILDTEDNETAQDTGIEAENARLQNELEAARAEIEKEKREYLFLMADFDNFRKRSIKEKGDILRNAGEKVLAGMLPIVDDMERGIAAASLSSDNGSLLKGLEMIYQKTLRFLESHGVKPMESTGVDFDADYHEAIATVPAPTPEQKGKVLDTTQRGYMINDKVLRHAKVAVGE